MFLTRRQYDALVEQAATFKVGEPVIFVNAANKAILATVLPYRDTDTMEKDWATRLRLHYTYPGDSTGYDVFPTADRVGRIGDTIRAQLANGLPPVQQVEPKTDTIHPEGL